MEIVNDMNNKPTLKAFAMLEEKREKYLSLGNIPKPRHSKYACSKWKQFKVLLSRKFRLTLSDKGALILQFMMPIFQSIIVGIMYMD